MLCLDTYALVEIAKNNPNFIKFIEEEFLLTDLILAEFYGVMMWKFDEKTAEYWFDKMSPYSEPVGKEVLKEAVKFRRSNKTKNFSFFDAVGYIYAVKNGCKFLTGDGAFEGLPNIEFVK